MIISDISAPLVEGVSFRDSFVAQFKKLPPCTDPNVLRVFLAREPFDDFYLIVLDNGQTEELDDPETRAWLKARGADEDLINASITQAWNFKSAMLHIKNPIAPKQEFRPEAPRLTLV